MTIIVPIHVEALRVTSSTQQTAKTALYQFDKLGKVATAAGGGMIAAENFSNSVTNLNTQPGVHLHWSLPRAYTKGVLDREKGQVVFPVLPNRWLVVRMLKNHKPATGQSATNTHLWILESDAHSVPEADQPLDGKSIAPWTDNIEDIQGLKGNILGRKLTVTGTWHEPNDQMLTLAATPGDGNHGYLGSQFQAPYGSGDTFTAYLPSSGNILGLYDSLSDYFTEQNALTSNAEFDVSYFVVGWVSDTASDVCNITLTQALADYDALPATGKPSLSSYLEGVMATQLKWSLSDYTGLTAATIPSTQAIMSGIVADISWNVVLGSNTTYPTGTPTQQDVTVSMGTNTADALSSYLNGTVVDPYFNPNAPEVDQKVEWLINALQFDQLPKLDSGVKGVGQLQEFLHGAGFSSAPGGYVWAVQQDKDVNQSQSQGNNNEVPLPPYLGQVLARLNAAQRGLDRARDDIAGQRRQLYLDWSYHAQAVQTNVIDGTNHNLSDDVTGSFLVDGLLHYFPLLFAAGSYNDPSQPTSAYAPTADSFSIAVPDSALSQPSEIATYNFLQSYNATAGGAAARLLELGIDAQALAEELVPLGLTSLGETYELLALAAAVPSYSPTAQHQIDTFVGDALDSLAEATAAIDKANEFANDLSDASTGLSAIATQAGADQTSIDALITAFKSYFTIQSVPTPLPLPPGQAFTTAVTYQDLKTLYDYTEGSNGFPGVKALLDTYGGNGGNPAFLSDTSLASYYLACAHIYALQTMTPQVVTCAYYLEFCLQNLTEAAANSGALETKLTTANSTLTTASVASALSGLGTVAGSSLDGIKADLTASPPNVSDALAKLGALLGRQTGGGEPDLTQISSTLLGTTWQDMRADIDAAQTMIMDRLPAAQKVSLLNTALYGKVSARFELVSSAATPYSAPNEPVILMGQPAADDPILKPFTRNGKAEIVPCRLPTEVVTAETPPTFPSEISGISTSIVPTQAGLSAVFQSLAEEAVLLTPELGSPVSAADLEAAAVANETLTTDAQGHVTLNSPPTGLSGKLPYYVAYNWRDGADPFLPLFIWWKAHYCFSDQADVANQTVPSSFMDQFQLGQYEVENHLIDASKNNFTGGNASTYNFDVLGIIAMTSNATYSLCEQISKYCATYLDYDPKVEPDKTASDYDIKILFYRAYQEYKGLRILSQGLNGFNPGMIQRVQEMQLPVNIPTSWTDQGYEVSSFWPTSFLHGQSADWPSNWNDQAPNPLALATNDTFVDFNPVRAGKITLAEIQLVDVFGRYISLSDPNPRYVSDQMQDPLAPNEIYLPPRLIQPTRIDFDWIAAETTTSPETFTETGSGQPPVSPICGWFWPNHLDNSLALYDANGRPMGSLGLQGTPDPADGPLVHWYPVPGETTSLAVTNRTAMTDYLSDAGANPVFVDVLTQFLFADETKATAARFNDFLGILEKSQSFVITKSLQMSQDLGLLVGRPLVVTQASIGMETKGRPDRASDHTTYPIWNTGMGVPSSSPPKFEATSSAYVPYQLDNFNDGGIEGLQIPTRIGTAMVKLPSDDRFPFFDDGLSGYFVGSDYGSFYTPVDVTSGGGIVSLSADDAAFPVRLSPNGEPATMTFIMDPQAAVHATTGVLPVTSIKIPEEQFNQVLRNIEITFLTAPVLTRGPTPELPIPGEQGFDWEWVTTTDKGGSAISGAQNLVKARFPDEPQSLVDGWLLLKRDQAES